MGVRFGDSRACRLNLLAGLADRSQVGLGHGPSIAAAPGGRRQGLLSMGSSPRRRRLPLACAAGRAPPLRRIDRRPRRSGLGGNDAKLQAMQRQLDDMRASSARCSRPASRTRGSARCSAVGRHGRAAGGNEDDAGDRGHGHRDPAAGSASSTTIPTLPNGKPQLATADRRFTANIKAILMFDGGKYFQKDNLPAAVTNRDLNEGFNFRRARIGIDGKLFRDFDYSFIYEFGGSGPGRPGPAVRGRRSPAPSLKPFRLKVSAFEPNIGLAGRGLDQPDAGHGAPGSVEVARSVAAGDSRVAFQVGARRPWRRRHRPAPRAGWSPPPTPPTSSPPAAPPPRPRQPFDEQTAWIEPLAHRAVLRTDWQAPSAPTISA